MKIKQMQVTLSMKNEELDVNIEELKCEIFKQLGVINASEFKIILNEVDTKHSKTPRFTFKLFQ